MDNRFLPPFCVTSTVDQVAGVRFACLDVRTGDVIRTTASFGPEADRMMFGTFCWLAAGVTIGLLALQILSKLHATEHSPGSLRARGRMG